ncbi:MAG: hypothetical protein WCW27_03140 [Patescibacteria group bacterium]|jgi:hypothetical protein
MEWPIKRLTFSFYENSGTPDGIVAFGTVKKVERDNVIYYAIQDGGLWHHPELQSYVGTVVGINLNLEQRRLEVVSWPQQQFLRALAEELLN